jgi:hypothetical protein
MLIVLKEKMNTVIRILNWYYSFQQKLPACDVLLTL